MRGEIIAIDLETTGLDSYNDAILEIGIARFLDGKITETYSTLIDPEREIPYNITNLTGIRQDDVLGAPKIHEVRDAVAAFIGDAPILGHNVGFDAGFLERNGIDLYNNIRLDTYELASVMLPRAPRYNLNSLTQQAGIELNDAHRALADASATGYLYWTLWEKVLNVPLNTLQEIVDAARGLDRWYAGPVFEAALKERIKTAFGEKPEQAAGLHNLDGLFGVSENSWKPLRPNAEPAQLNTDAIADLLGETGQLSRALSSFEHRPEQVRMLRAVSDGFNRSEHVMVEAGTGTGKSMAYLIPAIYWAVTNNERVVISTNTINLQEQILSKDIPMLKEVLGVDFRAAVVKGRSNYLCPRRLGIMHRRKPTTTDELRVYAKVLIWLLESNSGDRGEINLRGASEIGAWMRLSAEDDGCMLSRCQSQMHSTCPFYKARRDAEAAHIVIVNHALLLADVASGSRVLPEYNYLILDEAHHLEEATTNGLSFQVDRAAVRRLLSELGGRKSGILGDLLGSARRAVPDTHYTQLEDYVVKVEEAIKAMDIHVDRLFDVILAFLKDNRFLRASDFVNQVRITDNVRTRPGFGQIQQTWDNLSQFTAGISDAMSRLAMALGRLEDFEIPDFEDVVNNVGSSARHLQEVHVQLDAFANNPDSNTIYWVQVGQDKNRMSLHSAPLHVGPLIEKHLWHEKESVILTSATMQTAGSFEYIQDRLQAYDVTTLDVGTPFNYKDSTLIFLPSDMPEPNDRFRYQRAVEEALIELATATDGRLMGLFTSYMQLRQTVQHIAPRLALGDIAVFDQSDGTSRQALLNGFKETDRAVLLGTRSFWEGVDIPGDDLSALAITRLPFAVPSDPIFAARSETFDNAFMQFAVPDAILRFRQGFGRLIRTKTDRGVIVILDHRVLSKNYGQHFLDSLPECTIVTKPLAELATETLAWLNQ